MKTKHLLLTLLLALMVPMAALAQVERTVTVYNGTDKECHVPVYGNLNDGDRSLSQFIMDKNVLQTMGLTGKQITKMTFYLANPVPASYQWTTPRYTYVTLAEVDASELDEDGNVIQDMTDEQIVAHLYLDAQGETMEIAFSSPYTYSGEKNLLVQFEEQYQFYPSGYTPFGPYRKPVFYGVYKDGASGWNKVTYTGGHPNRLNKYNFVPKTTFTYLADEANFFNTRVPQNARTTTWYDGNNGNFNYKIQLQWDAPANYTGNYQVLCVPRGTSTLDWNNAYSTNNTSYTFEGLQKNTAYDLYVIARQNTSFFSLISAAATASATTPFYPANLDESNLVFDFNSRTMPNGLTLAGNATYLVRPYSDHTYSLNELGYYNVGAGVGSFDWMGRQHYLETSPLTITLPELKFTNASNGLMVEFDLKKEPIYEGEGPAEVLVKLYEHNHGDEVFSTTASTNESYYNGQHFTYRITNVPSSSNQHIFKLSFSSVEGGKGFTIDNIVVRKAPAIIPAYNLAASEITPNSATISWTDDNTNSHTFDLVYRQKGYSNDPNEWQHYVDGVSNPYTLTGLTPYTDYEVKVKTKTSSDYVDSEILGFSTQCTPATVPYNEPFAGLTTLPTNWRVNVPEYAEVVTEVGNGRLTLHNTATEVTQNIYGYISTYTSYSEFGAYIILPYFNNLGSLQLSFKAGRTQGTMESLSVGVVADPNNYTDYTEIGTATLTDNANGEVYSYNLVNNAVQSGHIVIYFGKYESNLQSIWLDDFSVQQYAAPTGLTVSNVTNTTATLGWNAGAATQWEVRYKATTDSSWGSAIAVTEPTYTITGLTASTDYVAQVRAKYGESPSVWVNFTGFRTLMQEAYALGATTNQTYFEGFQSSTGNWMLINGSLTNKWKRGSKTQITLAGTDPGYALHISNSADNIISQPAWEYTAYTTSEILGNVEYMGHPSTTYAAKTFTLSEGTYSFSFKYAVVGVAQMDYLRAVLVPANTQLTASQYMPADFSYANTPSGWIALDGGQAFTPGQQTSGGRTNYRTATISLDVYPGGQLEPGDYMMVFVWHNDGRVKFSAIANPPANPPGAIDDVSITWSPIITPPDMNTLEAAPTDTQATLTWQAPICTLTPTGYEVEYATDASFTDALTATTNTNSVTLTGLTANTNYYVRIRSAHTANGTTIYSDWSDARVFSTQYPTPTNLAVVRQTTSMAQVMWTPVEMTLPEGQRINYSWQLTTDVNDWGEANEGLASNGWERNLAPDTYHLRVRTAIYDNNAHEFVGFSDWSEPITFTIAPWTEPVTIFPLTYGFETPTYFDDGLTLGGALERLMIYNYSNGQDQLPAHAGGESQRLLGFASGHNDEAYLVLPPLRPSTMDALVSFWWYHDNTADNTNEGVTIEQSSNGTSWQQWGVKITRYAEETGWVKYEQVVPAGGTDPIYIRLHLVGANSDPWYKRCYLDDLTVTTFKSEQPYISYVGCDAYTATITLYDYAYQNGWPSSAFHVQYRKVGQDTWIDYADFVNQAPYAFENSLTINGLDPNSYYEFRACARVSYNGHDFAWSKYCEPYRQWTSNDVFTVTPTHPYEHDFEFGAYNWTEGSWNTQYEGGYNSSYCAYMSSASVSTLATPEIHFDESCDNVIIRFRVKGSGRFSVYYGENYAQSTVVNTIPSKSSWTKVEYSLSKYMAYGTVKIAFSNDYSTNTPVAMFVDDIEIIANEYDKVFDCQPGYPQQWNNTDYWYPHAVPTADEDVMIMGYARVGNDDGSNPYIAQAGNVGFGSYGYVLVYPGSTLEAAKVNVATTSSVMISDGGQLKLNSGRPYITMYKRFIGYNNVNDDDHFYLFAPPMRDWTSNPSGFTTGEYDLYRFDGENGGAEWCNYQQNTFVMQRGKGYLYAHAKPTTGNLDYTSVTMGGYVLPLGEETITGLVYGTNTDEQPFVNWNLVGNPFPCNAYLSGNRQFYRLVETAEGSRIVLATDNVIKPMEGVFVQAATAEESSVTFTTAPTRESGMNFTLSKKSQTRGAESVMADRVRIAIGEGRDLGHLDLMADANRLYIPLNGKDMAVMHSQPVGELPFNFEAAEDGTYTLSFENATEGLVYCHLIDNLTGADVDLLSPNHEAVIAGADPQSPAHSYTFTAKTTDYASRFRVVFAAAGAGGDACEPSFAFENNGNWIILNEGRATLQVIDLNGRVLSSEQIEGSVQTSIHQPAGLYLIRLLNGNDVKIQKVIVK